VWGTEVETIRSEVYNTASLSKLKNGMETWGLGCGSGKMDELIALYLSS